MQRNQNGQQHMKNVICPHHNDVINGRGKFAMHWNGNQIFRTLVESHKEEYLNSDNDKKVAIARSIINIIRTQNPPGRFLKLDASTNKWNDIRNKKAARKIRQALQGGTTNSNSNSVDSSYNVSQLRSVTSAASSNNDSIINDAVDNTAVLIVANNLEVSYFEFIISRKILSYYFVVYSNNAARNDGRKRKRKRKRFNLW